MAETQGRVYGIIGSGIGYSLSPRIFNALFRQHKHPAVYRLFDLDGKPLEEFVAAARLLRLDGFNVTIPFKGEIIEHLQKLDPVAAATGSVNLALNRRDKWTGFNTDYYGVEATLEKLRGFKVKGSRVVILGSGGAARTVYYLLNRKRAAQIVVYHHSAGRSKSFASYVDSLPNQVRCEARRFRSEITDLPECDLLVNCTPQPFHKMLDSASLHRAPHLFDLRYQGAGLRSTRIVDGSLMLAVQAAHNFKLMTGVKVNPEKVLSIMKAAR